MTVNEPASMPDEGPSDKPTTWSRRHFVRTGIAAGLGAAIIGASTPAAGQSSGVPSYAQAANDLSHPNPSEEAVALYRYLHDEWGERIMSGQQFEPDWSFDEIARIESITGQRPAVVGLDYIHGDKSKPTGWALDWWQEGAIPSIMWHWGVPGQDTPEDEYEQSRDTGVQIDLQQVLQEGTEPNQAFWTELAEVGDELERLRDAGVPVIWRPFHEFEGQWFWWGVPGASYFIELWETMHEYYVYERDLNNLIWLLPHTGDPNGAWIPDPSTFDLWGGDTYDQHPSYSWLYDSVTGLHGSDRPPILHECGRPPHPDDCAREGAWWSHWLLWHTSFVEDTDDAYLDEVYNHELTVSLDDVPDIVGEYGESIFDDCSVVDLGGHTAQDLDGDGIPEDVNGNGRSDFDDIVTFFEEMNNPGVQENLRCFDCNGNGQIDFEDIICLFEKI